MIDLCPNCHLPVVISGKSLNNDVDLSYFCNYCDLSYVIRTLAYLNNWFHFYYHKSPSNKRYLINPVSFWMD